MTTSRRASSSLQRALATAALFVVPASGTAQPDEPLKPLQTAVIKATAGTCLRGKTCHRDKAGVWVPKTRVGIVSASIAEQADVDVYVDIEISTKPEMYQCSDTDATGCVFRMKYAGPGLFSYGSTQGSTYLGSNITSTNITFPSGYAIIIPAGTPVYVHLDVINDSLIDLQVDQDAWLYYTPLP
ncbi:MAG TPA: hypothetical protein VNF72_00435 [Myxococcota bacterium]|nr:hypothetical protein [Myxococcota bacterium]